MATSEDLQIFVKKRVAVKGWLTRTMSRAEEILKAEKPDLVVMKDIQRELEMRLYKLDEVQGELELKLDSEEEMMADIEKAGIFRDAVMHTISRLKKAVRLREACDDSGASTAGSKNVKLPKLGLQKFGGNVLEWQSFWEMFKASVDDADLPDVTKFSYLRSLLTDEASTCIAGLPLSAGNYSAACKMLSDRFGRPERIVLQSHPTAPHYPIPIWS